MRPERGQVMVLVAILSTVLVGFVGLVIDVGGVSSDHELAQSAADGAALTAAYQVQQGSTEAAATTAAQAVLTEQGLPTADVTLSYLDSSGSPTASASLVRTVQAVVAFNYATRFLPILGIASAGISATAQAALPAPTLPCGLCVMNGSGTSVTLAKNSSLTVNGAGAVINSTSNPNVTVNNGSRLTAPSIRMVVNHVSGSGTVTPAPTIGSALSDPLSTLAVPSLSGSATAYSSPNSGSGSISPGIYSSITVNGTYALTLNAGTYVLTGDLLMLGGTLTGTGVTIYLTCSAYPTPCTAGGQAGALIGTGAGVLTLSAPTSGTYAGVVVFGDRSNNSTNTFSAGSGSVALTGTVYTLLMPLNLANRNDVYSWNSELVVAGFANNSGTSLTLTVTSSQQAPNQTGGASTGTVALSL